MLLSLVLAFYVGLPGAEIWHNQYMEKHVVKEMNQMCISEMNTPDYFKDKILNLSYLERYEYCMRSFGFKKKGESE